VADPSTDPVFVVSSAGEIQALPPDQAQKAIRLGDRLATAEDIAAHQREEKYSGFGQGLKAFGEGAADALTAGLSTQAETHLLGVAPEDIRGREEVQPIAHGLGTATGLIGPALLTGGASAAEEAPGLLGQAAELSAPSLITKAGGAFARGAEAALPEATSTTGRIARQAAVSGAGLAGEGALYGAAQVDHEAALGDPVLTGENAATIGLSALIGGGLGAAGGAGKELLSGLAGKTGPLADKLADWAGRFEGERNLKAAGAIQRDFTQGGNQIGREELVKLGQEMGDLGLVGPFSTPAKTAERARDLMDKAGQEIGSILEKADVVAKPEDLPRIDDITGRVRREVLDPLEKNPLQQGAAKQLGTFLDSYDQRFAGGMTFEDLHAVRRQISDALYGYRGNLDPEANAIKSALHDFRSIVSDEITSGLDRVKLDTNAWKTTNRQYQVAARAEDFAQRGMNRAAGNNLVPLTSLLGLIGGGAIGHGGVGASLAYGSKLFGSGLLGAGAGALRRALEGEEGRIAPALADETAATVSGEIKPGSQSTRVYTPQRPAGEQATYGVVEAKDLVPSHDPMTFRPRADYPEGVQERPYHAQPEEQRKVMVGAQKLNPDLLLTDTPTAVDGPPLVTSGEKPLVLGGNGRSMMIQRGFRNAATRDAYKEALLGKAALFGLDARKIAGMESPVLVRTMNDVSAQAPRNELAAAVRRFNEGMTQQLSPRARAVAEAKALSPETVQSIGELLADSGDDSLRDVMRSRPADLLAILQRDGVINAQNRSQWIAGNKLTDEAKDRIEGMFQGRAMGTADRLGATPADVGRKMERAAPHLMKVAGVNPALDETHTVRAALDLLNDAHARGMSVADVLKQGSMFGALHSDPAVAGIAEMLEQRTPREVGQRFKDWASRASVDPRQATMFGGPPERAEALRALIPEVPSDHISPAPMQAAESALSPTEAVEAPKPAVELPSPETADTIGVLAKANKRAESGLSQAIDRLVKGAPVAIKGLTLAESAHVQEQIEHLNRLANNPELLNEQIESQISDLHEHAPKAAASAANALARGIAYLQSQAPQSRAPGPLAKPASPSRPELAAWQRKFEAVKDPIEALTDGHLDSDTLAAIKAVYPAIYRQFQAQLTEKLMEKPDLSYQQKLRIGQILGSDLDGTNSQLMIAANLALTAKLHPKGLRAPPVPKASRSGASHLHLGRAKLTETQAIMSSTEGEA